MKQKLSYISFVLIAIAAIVGLSFSGNEQRAMLCSGIDIHIQQGDDNHQFITVDDVKHSIAKYIDSIQYKYVRSIAVFDIEQKLTNHPLIRSCNVFVDVHGQLKIDIEQRTPIIRIESMYDSFYIDEYGRLMPLSENYTARTIVANGAITNGYRDKYNVLLQKDKQALLLKKLYVLAQKIQDDSLLHPLIEQIYVKNESDFLLISKVGPPIIEIADIDNLEYKCKNLKAFYHSKKAREHWGQYHKISLKFKNQIICTKH